jgi:hypothetical protein
LRRLVCPGTSSPSRCPWRTVISTRAEALVRELPDTTVRTRLRSRRRHRLVPTDSTSSFFNFSAAGGQNRTAARAPDRRWPRARRAEPLGGPLSNRTRTANGLTVARCSEPTRLVETHAAPGPPCVVTRAADAGVVPVASGRTRFHLATRSASVRRSILLHRCAPGFSCARTRLDRKRALATRMRRPASCFARHAARRIVVPTAARGRTSRRTRGATRSEGNPDSLTCLPSDRG